MPAEPPFPAGHRIDGFCNTLLPEENLGFPALGNYTKDIIRAEHQPGAGLRSGFDFVLIAGWGAIARGAL